MHSHACMPGGNYKLLLHLQSSGSFMWIQSKVHDGDKTYSPSVVERVGSGEGGGGLGAFPSVKCSRVHVVKILQGYIIRNEGERHEIYCPTTKKKQKNHTDLSNVAFGKRPSDVL